MPHILARWKAKIEVKLKLSSYLPPNPANLAPLQTLMHKQDHVSPNSWHQREVGASPFISEEPSGGRRWPGFRLPPFAPNPSPGLNPSFLGPAHLHASPPAGADCWPLCRRASPPSLALTEGDHHRTEVTQVGHTDSEVPQPSCHRGVHHLLLRAPSTFWDLFLPIGSLFSLLCLPQIQRFLKCSAWLRCSYSRSLRKYVFLSFKVFTFPNSGDSHLNHVSKTGGSLKL